MSSKQRHRGQHANDVKIFSNEWIPVLNEAVKDLSYLVSRGYSDSNHTVKLVGDRYRLTQRQRKAVYRAYCSDVAMVDRKAKGILPKELAGKSVAIDGYNLLITVESALSGGIVIECRDGTYRDIASVHGTYRKVEETLPAIHLIGDTLQKLAVAHVDIFLDRPVSNSGRLKNLMYEIANEKNFPWEIQLVNNPDRTIVQIADIVVVSSDGWVLDHSKQWVNLHRYIVDSIPSATLLRLHG